MEATMKEEFDKQKIKEAAEACVWNYMSESPKEDRDNIVEWMVDFYEAGFNHGKLPKQAQEGLEKLGEKIGESEWDEIIGEFLRTGFRLYEFKDWIQQNYYPPKPKEK